MVYTKIITRKIRMLVIELENSNRTADRLRKKRAVARLNVPEVYAHAQTMKDKKVLYPREFLFAKTPLNSRTPYSV